MCKKCYYVYWITYQCKDNSIKTIKFSSTDWVTARKIADSWMNKEWESIKGKEYTMTRDEYQKVV